jgi:hypothetical protein
MVIATYRVGHVKPVSDAINGRHEEEENAAINGGDKNNICVYMNGAAGKYEFGTELKTKLEQNGIDVLGVRTIEG